MPKFYIHNNKDDDVDNNIFWVTMSDLMLGLAIIFISLFIFAIAGYSGITIKQKQTQMEISQQISKELKKQNIHAEIDKMTGDLNIPAVELFELNSYILTNDGKKLLDKISPIYINTIFENKDLSSQIENIVIEGHTDSQMYSGINSKNEQFIKNMDLSLKRANSVAVYILNSNYNRQFEENLRKKIVVEGKSYNEPILTNGKEDYTKSRRVEIKLKVTNKDIADILGLTKK